MSYTARIQNNQTGEVRERVMDLKWEGEGSCWWWTEGNFSCDCNREWEFQRAGNEAITEDPPCGNTRYTVIDIKLDDGSIFKID